MWFFCYRPSDALSVSRSPHPFSDVLSEVMKHRRLVAPPETQAPNFYERLGLGPYKGAELRERERKMAEAAERGRLESARFYEQRKAAAAKLQALRDYQAQAPVRVAGRAFGYGTLLAFGTFGTSIALFCAYHDIGSVEDAKRKTREELR